MQKLLWFVCGMFVGLTALSISRASVRSPKDQVTDDTAIYQKMSEIQVRKELKVDFDSDIQSLAHDESKFHDKKLPLLTHHSRLKEPIHRVSQQKYRGSKR